MKETETCLKRDTFLNNIHQIDEVRKKNVDAFSEYFYGKMRPYKMQLRWNGYGDDLVIYLCVCPGSNDVDLQWPFNADVTIKITNKLKSACQSISKKHCQIQKPTIDSFRSSEEFRFSFVDLINSGVLKDNCVIVECFVEFN